MEIEIDNADLEYLFKKYSTLVTDKHELYKVLPQTTDKMVELARGALKIKKDNQSRVDETGSFLSDTLKRYNQ